MQCSVCDKKSFLTKRGRDYRQGRLHTTSGMAIGPRGSGSPKFVGSRWSSGLLSRRDGFCVACCVTASLGNHRALAAPLGFDVLYLRVLGETRLGSRCCTVVRPCETQPCQRGSVDTVCLVVADPFQCPHWVDYLAYVRKPRAASRQCFRRSVDRLSFPPFTLSSPSKDSHLLQLLLRHDACLPAAFGVVFFQHLVQFADLTLGARRG